MKLPMAMLAVGAALATVVGAAAARPAASPEPTPPAEAPLYLVEPDPLAAEAPQATPEPEPPAAEVPQPTAEPAPPTAEAPQATAEPCQAQAAPKGTAKPGPWAPDLSSASSVEDVIPPVAEHIFEMGKGLNFVSLRTDYDARAISVRWKGEVPEDVLAYAASNPYGVSVTVVGGARYSRAELDAARACVLADPIALEIGIVGTELSQEGSGFTIHVTMDGVTAEQHARLARLSGMEAADITVTGGHSAPVPLFAAIEANP